ncbi:MAG: single-stranded DNA-binding protein [Agrococcus sp.]
MNEDVITVVGKLGGDPTLKSVHGDRVAEFRLASTARRKEGDEYVNGHTNWYSVEAWGDFAQHVAASLRKGDLIVLLGRLKIEQWESGEKRGTSVKIRAEHVGHSLRSGAVAKDRRPAPEPVASAAEHRPADEPGGHERGGHEPGRDEPVPVLQAAGQDAWTAPLAEPDQPF